MSGSSGQPADFMGVLPACSMSLFGRCLADHGLFAKRECMYSLLFCEYVLLRE